MLDNNMITPDQYAWYSVNRVFNHIKTILPEDQVKMWGHAKAIAKDHINDSMVLVEGREDAETAKHYFASVLKEVERL